MTKYIKLEELMKFPIRRNHYNTVHGNDFVSGIEMVLEYAKNIPAADVAPVRHGRWIDAYPDIEPNPMFMYGICSECGFEQGISKYLNYCPNCGAKMDEDNEPEN